MTELIEDISPLRVRNLNRNRDDGFPTRDHRRSPLATDLVRIKEVVDAETEAQPDHSAEYEDEGVDSDDDKFRLGAYDASYGPTYGQSLAAREARRQPHRLDDAGSRPSWTYADPAKVTLRLHDEQH